MAKLIACLVVLAAVMSGCASVDPTDPSGFTDVFVRNDTARPVVLAQCDTSCETLHERFSVAGGATARINVSNEGITVGYVVERPSEQRVGCLYMRFQSVRKTPSVQVSSVSRCH